MKLRFKLGLFNVLSKIVFGLLIVFLMPILLEHVNTIQTDNELIEKRESVIDLISEYGIGIMFDENENSFGSYNILKEEYISLEKFDNEDEWNFIEVTRRMVEGEIIEYRVLNYSLLIDGEKYLLEIGKSLASIRQTERNIRNLTIILLLLFILLSFATDMIHASRLVIPVEILTKRLRATSTPSMYDQQPVKTSTTEYAYLDNSLRELMKKMDLLIQNEKQTTANISHELLTPVAVLRSKLENIQAMPDLNEEAAIKIEESLKTIYRLKSMVNSLLMIARLESRQYLKEEDFSVNDILENIREELMPLWEDKEITVILNTEVVIELIQANRALIFTMLYNVFNNAIKFSQPKGVIIITTERKDNLLYLSIADNGPGMNETTTNVIFERFRKKTGNFQNGNGIGLAITKSIADFHNIGVNVKSKTGEGFEFTFAF
jgi:signal transduction histidine kinase